MRTSLFLTGAALIGLSALPFLQPALAEDSPHLVPAPVTDLTGVKGPQTAVLSGGCFWGVQGVFEHVKGVQRVLAGYSGGKADTAQYETVSSGTTGHAESVQITYDPSEISYGKILQIFFSVVLDPTTKNYQGPDHGTQYRSEIFAANPEQRSVAKSYIAQLDAAHAFDAPIVTRVDKLTGFYPAEAYHQDFLALHPSYPYIVYNDLPKVEALKTYFPAIYTPSARLSGLKS